MNDLIEFKKIWDKFVDLWRNHFAAILACVLFFFFGATWATKSITDDCKFAKNFRDSTQVYNCELRLVR